MNYLVRWLINHLLFAGTLFLASGAAVGDVSGGADAGAIEAGDTGAETTGTDGADVSESADGLDVDSTDAPPAAKPAPQTPAEEPEVAEFKGQVSGRLRGFIKQAPELGQVFQKHPDIQAKIEATMRREAAYRDVGMTVAEVRQIRENFPNGLQDVQLLRENAQQLDEIDNLFYKADAEGNYTGHVDMMERMFSDDPAATQAFLRTAIKEFGRRDPEAYSEVVGKILGATFTKNGVPSFLAKLITSAKTAKQDGIAESLEELSNWVNGYLAEKPAPSAEEARIAKEKSAWEKQKAQQKQADVQKFNQTVNVDAQKIQVDTIRKHPAMLKVAQSRVPPEKLNEIVGKVHEKIRNFLLSSPSVKAKLKAAYDAQDRNKILETHKAAWSQPWLLNRMVRDVLKVETPALVEGNRAAVQRRTTTQQRPPASTSANQRPTKPFQQGGQWFKPDGSKFTTMEVMKGDHLK